jgi:hypothetical protein
MNEQEILDAIFGHQYRDLDSLLRQGNGSSVQCRPLCSVGMPNAFKSIKLKRLRLCARKRFRDLECQRGKLHLDKYCALLAEDDCFLEAYHT